MKGGVVETRAQRRARELRENPTLRQRSPSPSPPSPPPPIRRSVSMAERLNGITEEQCDEFIKNPRVNPLTKKMIKPFSPVYHSINKMCQTKFNKGADPHQLYKEMINNPGGNQACVYFVNLFTVDSQDKLMAYDLLSEKRVYFEEHDYLQTALEQCKEKHGIILIRLPIPPQSKHVSKYNKTQPFLILKINETNRDLVVLSDYEDLRAILLAWLEYSHEYRVQALTREVIKQLMDVIDLIFKYNYLQPGDEASYFSPQYRGMVPYDAYEDLQKIYSELAFMYYGVKLKHLELESSEPTSKNRSKSISSSKKKGLPELPKKTRQELLQEIETTCKEVIDVFTQDEFKDLKKKQLQLLVKIGRPHDGKQNCYKVEGLYNHILTALKENLPIRDPLNKAHTLTEEEIKEVETKIKYLDPEAPPLKIKNQKMFPNVKIHFIDQVLPEGNFYAIWIERTIGIRITWQKFIGYLPDIDTEAADINSGTIIVRLQKLMKERKLLDPYFIPRIHLNKSAVYWNLGNPDETKRKLRLMSDEIRSLE